MRILITGSRGALGPVLRAELERRGHDVFGVDARHSWSEKEMRADVAECRQVARAFHWSRPDVVYHFAAEFGRNNGQEFYEQLWRTNQVGTRNVIDQCLKHGARMVLAGSSEAYGESSIWLDQDHAMLEESFLDKHSPAFHNEYALSKWAQERQVFIAAQNDGLRAVVLRFFNAYGPGEYYSPYRSVVALFCYRLKFGLPIVVYKNYHRVFQFIGDWARTVANVAELFDGLRLRDGLVGFRGSRPACVPVYNIGGAEYRSVEELAALVVREVRPRNQTINFVDKEAANVTNKRPDIEAARRDLSHDPRTTLEEGVPRTLAWMEHVYDTDGRPFESVYSQSLALERFYSARAV